MLPQLVGRSSRMREHKLEHVLCAAEAMGKIRTSHVTFLPHTPLLSGVLFR